MTDEKTKCVTVHISEKDYDFVVDHFARDGAGKPLVGIVAVWGEAIRQDIAEAKKIREEMREWRRNEQQTIT